MESIVVEPFKRTGKQVIIFHTILLLEHEVKVPTWRLDSCYIPDLIEEANSENAKT